MRQSVARKNASGGRALIGETGWIAAVVPGGDAAKCVEPRKRGSSPAISWNS